MYIGHYEVLLIINSDFIYNILYLQQHSKKIEI